MRRDEGKLLNVPPNLDGPDRENNGLFVDVVRADIQRDNFIIPNHEYDDQVAFNVNSSHKLSF